MNDQGNLVSKKTIIAVATFLIIIIGLIFFYIFVLRNNEQVSWIIPQTLYKEIATQQLLKDKESIPSSLVNSEAFKIGNDVWFSTGEKGEVSGFIPLGKYRVKAIAIPNIDFTNLPREADFGKTEEFFLNLGLSKGVGIAKEGSKNVLFNTNNTDNSTSSAKLTIKLFNDENGDGEKNGPEGQLNWAGVTFRFEKIN